MTAAQAAEEGAIFLWALFGWARDPVLDATALGAFFVEGET